MSVRDIELFTEMTGDRNPLHYDEEAAAASPFGEIIVQGGVTPGILNAIVAEDLPGPGTVFLNASWDFKASVRPGDEITGAVEVLEAREDKPITQSAHDGDARRRRRRARWDRRVLHGAADLNSGLLPIGTGFRSSVNRATTPSPGPLPAAHARTSA